MAQLYAVQRPACSCSLPPPSADAFLRGTHSSSSPLSESSAVRGTSAATSSIASAPSFVLLEAYSYSTGSHGFPAAHRPESRLLTVPNGPCR